MAVTGSIKMGGDIYKDVLKKYEKPENGIPAEDLAEGVIPDVTDLIDDTAGAGTTDKTFSANKLTEMDGVLKSAIERKFGVSNLKADGGLQLDIDMDTGKNYLVAEVTGGTIAPNYFDLTFPVRQGQYCMFGGNLWIANTEIATQEGYFNRNHWTQVDVGTSLEEVKKTKADIIITNSSGSIASISDGADDLPVESLVVQIEPVQDLHGQSAPYPAGGGKNILPPSGSNSGNGLTTTPNDDGSFTVSGTATGTGGYITPVIALANEVPANTSIAISIKDAITANIRIFLNSPAEGTMDILSGQKSTSTSKEYVISAVRFYLTTTAGQSYNFKIYPQVEIGSTATAWSPYSNICPISGWTGTNVYRTGKNLFNVYALRPGNFDTANVFPTGNVASADFVSIKPGKYTWSQVPYGVSGGRYVRFYDKDKTAIGTPVAIYSDRPYTFTVPEDARYCRFMIYRSQNNFTSYDDVLALKPMIEVGETASDDYEPYYGSTYPITWEDAGTVYGGTLNPVTGKLVVDRVSEEFTFVNPSTNNGFDSKIFTLTNTSTLSSSKNGKMTNVVDEYAYTGAVHGVPHFYIGGKNLVVYLKENTYRGGVIQACYPLATPITYTLTPTEIRTLLGKNNIWADTGDVSVDYRADTRLYVERMSGGISDVQVNGTSVVSSGVANIPIASTNGYGAVKLATGNGVGNDAYNRLYVIRASGPDCKVGTGNYTPITPGIQHLSAFYGLSKIAGYDLKNVTVTEGVYPEESKSAISEMLNGAVSVSGTTPSITAKAGVRYICGECSTLTIVAPASGCIDVTFVSGSTPTVLTVNSAKANTSVKWANGFDPTALEANTTYEINILDGCLGVAGSWT